MIEKADSFRTKLLPPTITDSIEKTRQMLEQKPGRFKLPRDYALRRKIKSLFYSLLNPLGVVSYPLLSGTNDMFAAWQPLIDLLYTNGFLEDRRIQNIRCRHDAPFFYGYVLKGPKYEGWNVNVKGAAISDVPEEALSKTVGELLERSLTAKVPAKQIHKSQSQLPAKKILDLSFLNGFLDWQRALFPQYGVTPNDVISWSECSDITNNRKILVPTQLITWNNAELNKEKRLVHATTNGSGGYFSREGAIISSIYENVQRDGFFMFWLNTISPPHITIDSIQDAALKELIAYFVRYRFEIYLLDTTSDIPMPSCTCVLLDTTSGYPQMYVGAGTDFDPARAIQQSILEACSVAGIQRPSVPVELPHPYKPFRDSTIGRTERLNLWQGGTMFEHFKFFISGSEISFFNFSRHGKDFASEGDTLAHMISLFKSMGTGYDILVRDVEDEILPKIGYHVVKTVIPKLFPMYLNESMPTLDSERLRTVPKKLGYTVSGELNPWPHPFP